MTLQTGERFPDFTGASHQDEQVTLSDYRAGQPLVVFFYPKATTGGCVRETTEFAARQAEFDALGTRIVGISVDEVADQKTHAVTCAVSFPVLSDAAKQLTSQLDILNENGRAKRTTYVIDREGKVRRVFEGVNVDGHVDEVLAAVKQL